MQLVVLLAVGAVVAGLLRGGSLERLANTKFRASPLLIAGLGLQIVFSLWSPEWMAGGLGLGVLIGSNILVLSWLVVNRSLPGIVIAALGLVLNLAVISANGAMPVSPEAARDLGVENLEISGALKHEVADDGTRLVFLCDVIPLPGVGILSLGDLVLAAGIAVLAYAQTRRGPEPEGEASG